MCVMISVSIGPALRCSTGVQDELSLAAGSLGSRCVRGAWCRIAGVQLRLVFFFQAEDGIRDSSVTGVQTCALPISCGYVGGTAKATSGYRASGTCLADRPAADRRGGPHPSARRLGRTIPIGGRGNRRDRKSVV